MARALLIVDHGTRRPESNAGLAELARRVGAARPGWRVAHAHMELAQPDVPTAIEALVEAGATEIHLHLHFLGRGYHVRETIPALVEAARSRHDHVRFHVTDPIGEDPRLIDIVVERIDRLEG